MYSQSLNFLPGDHENKDFGQSIVVIFQKFFSRCRKFTQFTVRCPSKCLKNKIFFQMFFLIKFSFSFVNHVGSPEKDYFNAL